MAKGGNGSHWEGCYEAHHDCAVAALVEARAEVERLKTDIEERELGRLVLANEIVCMKPVVDAAVAWDESHKKWQEVAPAIEQLGAAVDTYRKGASND